MGGATDVMPIGGFNFGQQGQTIKFPIAQKDDIGLWGNDGSDLSQQLDMGGFRKVTFAAFDHRPGQR
jgi:hypothetical protein